MSEKISDTVKMELRVTEFGHPYLWLETDLPIRVGSSDGQRGEPVVLSSAQVMAHDASAGISLNETSFQVSFMFLREAQERAWKNAREAWMSRMVSSTGQG